jgi:hypothetical protein
LDATRRLQFRALPPDNATPTSISGIAVATSDRVIISSRS